MLRKSSKFNHYKPCHTFIELADRNTLKSVEEGYIQLLEGDGSIIQLKALHIPQLAGTLISFGRLFIQGCNLVRNGNSTFNMVEDSITLLLTEFIDGTCNVKLVQSPQGQSFTPSSTVARRISVADVETLHSATGHPSKKKSEETFPRHFDKASEM